MNASHTAYARHGFVPLVCFVVAQVTVVAAERLPAPLFDTEGKVHHPVTTRSDLAQRYFDQGLALAYGFNHNEAIRSFNAAATLDPDCAMAYWGIAYVNGPHVNAPMFPEQVAEAWTALQKAQARKDKVSPRERDYIDAMAKRYAEKPPEDRALLDKAYAEAMRSVYRKYADDLDAAVLYAEATMDTMPWDYWTKDLEPKPEMKDVLVALESVIARNPEHPGANHLYIHAVEAGPRPQAGLPSADRLRSFSLQLGHLVHMPSHIYLRVGQFADASRVNELAAAADENYLSACRVQGFYPGAYYPHNVHFLWYSTSFEGRSADSIAAAKKIAEYSSTPMCGTTKVEAVRQRHVPFLAYARFGKWDEILKASQPAAEFPFDRAMWHYARATAFAARGDAASAEKEAVQFRALAATDEVKKLDSPYFPGTAVLAVASAVVDGRVASAKKDGAARIAALELAVKAEDAVPYMEPAFWYYPTRQTLAVAYLQSGRIDDAEKTFREDLRRNPRNGWSLYGLAAVLRAAKNEDAARFVDAQFATAWNKADITPDLSWY